MHKLAGYQSQVVRVKCYFFGKHNLVVLSYLCETMEEASSMMKLSPAGLPVRNGAVVYYYCLKVREVLASKLRHPRHT